MLKNISETLNSLTLSESSLETTPYKNNLLELTEANSIESSPSFVSPTRNVKKNRKSTLNSIPGLPPLRNANSDNLPSSQDSAAKETENIEPEKQKPSWNSSIQKPVEITFAQRCPWTPDLRMRKTSSVAAEQKGIETTKMLSPRTPFVSQANIKRVKQVSQLSRTVVVSLNYLIRKVTETVKVQEVPQEKEEFIKPALNKSSAQKNKTVDALKAEIKALTKKLEEEQKARQELELKYQNEIKKRFKVETELKMLLKQK